MCMQSLDGESETNRVGLYEAWSMKYNRHTYIERLMQDSWRFQDRSLNGCGPVPTRIAAESLPNQHQYAFDVALMVLSHDEALPSDRTSIIGDIWLWFNTDPISLMVQLGEAEMDNREANHYSIWTEMWMKVAPLVPDLSGWCLTITDMKQQRTYRGAFPKMQWLQPASHESGRSWWCRWSAWHNRSVNVTRSNRYRIQNFDPNLILQNEFRLRDHSGHQCTHINA